MHGSAIRARPEQRQRECRSAPAATFEHAIVSILSKAIHAFHFIGLLVRAGAPQRSAAPTLCSHHACEFAQTLHASELALGR
jgi:hypothetical protein